MSSYIESNLMSGEEIIYRAHLHWIIFRWPIIWLILAIIFFSGGPDSSGLDVLFLLICIVHGIIALISFKTSEFGITNKRIIGKIGFIRRNSIEILLSKVEGIQVKQGILGRILGYGSVVITGTGGLKDPFKRISKPLEFRKKAQELI